MSQGFLASILSDSTITGIFVHKKFIQSSNYIGLCNILIEEVFGIYFSQIITSLVSCLIPRRDNIFFWPKSHRVGGPSRGNHDVQNLELTPEIKVCLLLDICSGLQKIEEVLGYHGAINAYNCFLDGNFRVKDSELYSSKMIRACRKYFCHIFTHKQISNYAHIEWHMHKNDKNPSKNDLELYHSPEKLRLEWGFIHGADSFMDNLAQFKSTRNPILGADHALYDNKHLLQNDIYSFGILMLWIYESYFPAKQQTYIFFQINF